MIKNFIKKYFKHFSYFYSYLRYRIFVALILSIIVGLLDSIGLVFFLPLLSLSSGEVVKNENSFGNFQFLNTWITELGLSFSLGGILLCILILLTFKNIIRFIEGVYSTNSQRDFVVTMRKELVRLFKDYKYAAYTSSNSGKIQATLTTGINSVVAGYQSYTATLQSIIIVIVYLAVACYSNFKFAILVIIGGILTNFIFKFIYSQTKAISKKLTRNSHSFQGLIIQSVAFFKYLKATNTIHNFNNRIEYLIDTGEKYTRQMGMINTFLISIREPIVLTVLFLVIYLQVTYTGEGITSILISVMLFYRALNVLMTLQTSWNSFMQNTGALENMQEFKAELIVNKQHYGKQKFHQFQHSLDLKHVSFKYENGDLILKDINLTIHKNETMAFVGESGSGKTTIVNLIAGLLAPTTGVYKLDDIEIERYDIRQFQNRIGYITQEPIVFDDSLFNNITFWDEPTPENLLRFKNAIEGASIAQFVNELPEKEQTRLGNNGIMVSGGQKQRISIARELYKELDILVMDEATSALDSETEKAIQENIDSLKGKYTIIIVAHRLSTIKNADRIVLMEKGNIKDIGDFETLKNRNPYFNRMVSLQEV
ncbi:MAG: ABC transporter ATP-binding protein [Bacteroidia bacterium]|nr:ABC transporter ATP-binding protein [Bacteroidia bacterium]